MPTPPDTCLFADLQRIARGEPSPVYVPHKPTPEEIQSAFDELDRAREWSRANAPKRRLRNIKIAAAPSGLRQRCGARVKKPIWFDKQGRRHHHGPRCKAWAMENGRCWHHGGASTGARTPEGKARQVAAMIEGRARWVARQHALGAKFLRGRKGGARWITESMAEAARAEAHRLGANRFDLDDRSLVLALLKSAGRRCCGRPKVPLSRAELAAKAKAMLDVHERSFAEKDRQAALAAIGDLRTMVSQLEPGSKIPAQKIPRAYRDFIFKL